MNEYFGTPYPEDVRCLNHLAHPVLSDPFIPENIRDAVVDLLENRLAVLGTLHGMEFEKYAGNLAKGKQQLLDEDDLAEINKIHNRIVDEKNKRSSGSPRSRMRCMTSAG
jgi:hypothetical protein